MNTMRILFLINNLSDGGAERVLVSLANDLARKGHEITVRALSDSGENRKLLSSQVCYEYVYKNRFRGENYLHFLPKRCIYQKVAHGSFDVIVVYLHGVLTKIVSYAPKEQKTIAYLHANMEKSPFIKSMRNQNTIQKYFRNYNRIVAVSEDVKDSFIRVSGIDDGRVVVKYNTFDVEGIRRKAKEEMESRFRKRAAFSLCSVGKLVEVKGYMRLLSVVNRLLQNGFDIQLTIVGEGMQRTELEQYIEQNNLQEHVCLAGFDVNPYKYIAQSNLFVCSSFSEGFSSVVAESLMLGVPVITTDCAGMREMLGERNEYGVIVKNDEDSLYAGIADLLSSPEKMAYYRDMAVERSDFFEPKQTVGAVEEMLKEVVECRS